MHIADVMVGSTGYLRTRTYHRIIVKLSNRSLPLRSALVWLNSHKTRKSARHSTCRHKPPHANQRKHSQRVIFHTLHTVHVAAAANKVRVGAAALKKTGRCLSRCRRPTCRSALPGRPLLTRHFLGPNSVMGRGMDQSSEKQKLTVQELMKRAKRSGS